MAQTLPEWIHARRVALGRPITEAAERAGTSRPSWRRWENGRVKVHEHNWHKVEAALDWVPGSVADVLAGREPTPALPPDHDLDPLTGERYTGAELELWKLRHDLGRRHRARLGEQRAAELGEQRARDLIAFLRTREAMDSRTARVA